MVKPVGGGFLSVQREWLNSWRNSASDSLVPTNLMTLNMVLQGGWRSQEPLWIAETTLLSSLLVSSNGP